MNIIILGPQGSGKGTQAELLSNKFGLYHHDTTFLREIAKGSQRIREIMDKGELIPDNEMFNLTKEELIKRSPKLDNIIFDGYPRSKAQYYLLRDWLNENGKKISSAIFLDVSEEESVKRISSRRICERCGEVYNLITNPPKKEGICDICGGNLIHRDDDKADAIKERLALYRKETIPLLALFEKEGILMKVDGERPIEVIFKDIVERLGKR